MAEPWELYQDQSGQKRPEPWDSYLKDERLMAPPVDQGEDIRRAGASGALHGFASLPGAVGDVENLWGNTVNLGMRNLLRALGPLDQKNAYTEDQLFKMFPKNEDYANMPTGQQSDQVFQKFTPLGEEYTGQTDLGKAANWTGRFAPAALGAKGLGSAGLRVGASAGGAKVGGDAADLISGGNEDARMYGQILGGMGGAYGATRGPLARGVEGLDKSIWGGTKRAYNSTLGRLQPAGDPNARFSGAGEMPRIGPEPPPPEPPPAPIDRELARKGRMTPEKFDKEMAPYEALGVDPFEYQLYGRRAGKAKLGGLSRDSNLDVGEVVRERLDPAIDELQTRALDSVAKMIDGRADSTDAMGALDRLQERIRTEGAKYDTVLTDNAVTPDLKKRINYILEVVDEADMEKINREGLKVAKGLRVDKLNDAREAQIVKQELWNYAEDLEASPKTKTRGGIYKRAFYELQQALHDGIPGYREIDGAYSNLLTRAKLSQQIVDRITKLTDGTSPGNIGRNQFTAKQLREAFGDDASAFIDSQKLIAKDARDHNYVNPDVGSVSAPVISELVGGALDTMAGGPPSWLAKAGNTLIDSVARTKREMQGDQLSTRADAKRRAEFRKQLEVLEAERRAAALAQALGAYSGGRPPPSLERDTQ